VRNVALLGGILGAALPVALAIPVVLLHNHPADMAVFVGVVMAATSVSISAQTLLELGVLRTKEGFGLLATAVVDDIIAILMLSVAVALLGSQSEAASWLDITWIFARMALYLAGGLALAWFVLPRLFSWLQRQPSFSARLAAFALVTALIFGWSAQALGGIAAITGAFMAGMGLSQTTERIKYEIEVAVQSIAYALLVPIFFVHVGLITNLRELGLGDLPFALALLAAAVIAKVIGSGIGARLGGFSTPESFRLGVCMISRGEVGLIIAALGLSQGLISADLFQPIFLVILLTTILTPPLVRWVFRQQREQLAINAGRAEA
jgi:Kef-type K+ transport system membrane component KefB